MCHTLQHLNLTPYVGHTLIQESGTVGLTETGIIKHQNVFQEMVLDEPNHFVNKFFLIDLLWHIWGREDVQASSTSLQRQKYCVLLLLVVLCINMQACCTKTW